MEKKLSEFAKDAEIKAILEEKCSVYKYSEIRKEFADIKIKLGPLIDKGVKLKDFIEHVNTQEREEFNIREFNQKIEMLKARIHDVCKG